jgi:polyhydroxybutyrate depolymerase
MESRPVERMRSAVLLVLLLAAPVAGLGAEPPCDPCRLAGVGSFRVLAPPDWDGHAKLPVLMFLHGYTLEGADVLADADIAGPAAALGFLLVAPDGLEGTWSHQGSPSQARDDRLFLHSVLAEVKRRWPVDARLVVLGGFSQGASMVWDMACFAPLGFTAFLPFSGGFWERMPTACTAPVNLRHVHGTADEMVPLEGRSVLEHWRQADIERGFAIWRETDHCTSLPERHMRRQGLECEVWSCHTRRTLELCLHPGGHEMAAGWLEDGLRWARAESVR